MQFTLIQKDTKSSARAAVIKTDHSEIETPVFMPVGTVGTVKGIHFRDLKEDVKTQIILGNTYHLYLRPGARIIEQAGGLHKFTGWDGTMLTDSGGYQVYSLTHRRKLNAEGVLFQSHIDGSRHHFTPENVIDTQRSIGADIMMAFDECTPYPCDYEYAKNSLDITHHWLARCMQHYSETEPIHGYSQCLFPIVQGSTFSDLRKKSAETIASYQAGGNAIGGLSVGEPHEMMYEITDLVCNILPKDKPRYLMGVGTPENILESIALGIDMFDCVMPTRNGRNGMLFTKNGIINIKNKKWEDDFSPVDNQGNSFVDKQYSRAYLRHLFSAHEMLGGMICSLHNLSFYRWLVSEARKHILTGNFIDWKKLMVKKIRQRL